MARIRSVHPGLFSDPEFVQVSMTARMALIGIWTEADDHGVFEWKPLALKMKIFPGDTVDMGALMAELVSADRVRQVEAEGKVFGICRNFSKYQKPKSPSYRYPFSPSWGKYTDLKSDDSDSPAPGLPQDTHSSPENPPLMEEGGDSVEDEGKKKRGDVPQAPDLSAALNEWNETAEDLGLARAQVLTDKRQRHLRKRLESCGGIEGWRVMLAKIRGSPGLQGVDGGWKADFDFVVSESGFTKIMEGKYDGWGTGQKSKPSGLDNGFAKLATGGGG